MQCVWKKTIHSTFDQNFSKSGPIYKILSLSDVKRLDAGFVPLDHVGQLTGKYPLKVIGA